MRWLVFRPRLHELTVFRIPDIVRHMSNVIVRAEREILLATNYWQNGEASKFITNAMRELDKRAGKRGARIVMKVIYDRGSPKQVFDAHQAVPEKEYTKPDIAFPPSDEIPNIDLQVMNYHQPLVGTFHAKYMVVDRKIAILQSNNIQDNDNLEMMIHLEGPIVDSFYDMALISWHKKMEPPLPSHNTPAVDGGVGSFNDSHGKIFGPEGTIQGHAAVVDPAKMPPREAYGSVAGQVREPGVVKEREGPGDRLDPHRADTLTGPTTTASTLQPKNTQLDGEPTGAIPNGGPAKTDTETRPAEETNIPQAPDAETQTFLQQGEQAIPQEQIHRPSLPQNRLAEHTGDDPHYDDDIAGEVARVQASVQGRPGETPMEAVTRHLNHTTNEGFPGDAPGCAAADEMTPYIPHAAHAPFPIAMVNRRPYGPPTHRSVLQPQNAAWLSALRNARRNVFIQSPTLNAAPLLPAIREACERGVDVYCYICLGYNDSVRSPTPILQYAPMLTPRQRESCSRTRTGTTSWWRTSCTQGCRRRHGSGCTTSGTWARTRRGRWRGRESGGRATSSCSSPTRPWAWWATATRTRRAGSTARKSTSCWTRRPCAAPGSTACAATRTRTATARWTRRTACGATAMGRRPRAPWASIPGGLPGLRGWWGR